jgi:hypothetical protein
MQSAQVMPVAEGAQASEERDLAKTMAADRVKTMRAQVHT